MFNGQTSTVAVPCKYRLADIQCGDYRLVVTPGSKLDSNNTFSPDTVWVKIKKSGLKEKLVVRTASSRLQKVKHRVFLLRDGTILPIVSYPRSTAMIASGCVFLVVRFQAFQLEQSRRWDYFRVPYLLYVKPQIFFCRLHASHADT